MGGDWYDVYPLADGRVTCVVGDVVGRGALAASVMAEIRAALRAYLHEGHEPARAMELLNNLLVAMGRERCATVAMMQLDLETSEMLAVSAGHPPAVLVTPDGQAHLVEPRHGLLLGIKKDVRFYSHRFRFPVGSVLLLYTDGLIERRDESLDEGLERLAGAALDAARRDDDSFADRVYRALVGQAATDDDIALLAIEWLPLGPSLEMTLEAKPTVLAGLRRTLGRWLSGRGVDEDSTFDITLATSEAAGNSIEHAYGAREGRVSVNAEVDEAEIRVTVADHGCWREPRPSGRGRGLMMMRGLVDSVELDRASGGTSVTLTKRRTGGR
jgi:anti-sigma regulatory factor (Ser/Thr protein kinase)